MIKHSGRPRAPSRHEARVRALESLRRQGIVDPKALDTLMTPRRKVGPRNGRSSGQRVGDPASSSGYATPRGIAEWATSDARAGLVVLETDQGPSHGGLHACSYPWPVLGLPVGWYKRRLSRARGHHPRGVRASRVSSATSGGSLGTARRARYLVRRASRRHRGHERGGAAGLVTRDAMIASRRSEGRAE